MTDLFVYGTLMLPTLWRRLTGRTPPPSLPAVLPRHRRRRVAGRPYPGMVADPHEMVHGLLYLAVPPVALDRLDRYDGREYRRVRCTVLAGGRPRRAECWLFVASAGRRLTDEDWHPGATRAAQALAISAT